MPPPSMYMSKAGIETHGFASNLLSGLRYLEQMWPMLEIWPNRCHTFPTAKQYQQY
jgi:hypothetical protein